MKRFVDYNPSDQEIVSIFGSKRSYEGIALPSFNEEFKDGRCGDYEKLKIARLLFGRGQRKEARKMIESIEDESYRLDCLQNDYTKWCMWEEGYV